MMVSVCMATKNGAPYIAEQLYSILVQLEPTDEIIISDDCSSDNTIKIIQSIKDPRIRLFQNNTPKGISKNFETGLRQSKGQFIFLADQDDVWLPHKIKVMLDHLKYYDLVVCNCLLVDYSLRKKNESFFALNNSGPGLLRNILKNSYIGCCMAFSRELLNKALPFPKDIPMHDFWIGLIGELNYNVRFIPEVLVYHRRHSSNASSTGNRSALSLFKKFNNRYRIIKNLLLHKSYAR